MSGAHHGQRKREELTVPLEMVVAGVASVRRVLGRTGEGGGGGGRKFSLSAICNEPLNVRSVKHRQRVVIKGLHVHRAQTVSLLRQPLR